MEQVQDRLKTHKPSDRKNAPTASGTSALDELGLVFTRASMRVLAFLLLPALLYVVCARVCGRVAAFGAMGDGRIVFTDAKIEKLKEEEEAGKEAKREYKRQKKEEANAKAKEVRKIVDVSLRISPGIVSSGGGGCSGLI